MDDYLSDKKKRKIIIPFATDVRIHIFREKLSQISAMSETLKKRFCYSFSSPPVLVKSVICGVNKQKMKLRTHTN